MKKQFLLPIILLILFFTELPAMDKPMLVIPPATIRYPLYPKTEIYESGGPLGRYLRATADIPAGTIVAKFQGSITEDSTARHSKWVGRDTWGKDKFIIVESSAVYVNHSCDPNSAVNNTDWSIQTTRDVKKGEALTIYYNKKEDFPADLEWDRTWDFDCYCRTGKCPKKITGWQK
jgi:hypothetical protein